MKKQESHNHIHALQWCAMSCWNCAVVCKKMFWVLGHDGSAYITPGNVFMKST